jgi:hypothetical protein
MGKFLIKLLLNGVVVTPLLYWFTEATMWSALLTALTLACVAYVLGDQMVLRFSNNTIATIADAVLAFFFLWGVAAFMNWSLSWSELFTIVVLLGAVEIIFHRLLGTDKLSNVTSR